MSMSLHNATQALDVPDDVAWGEYFPPDEPERSNFSEPVTPAEGIVPLGHDRGVFHYLSRSSRQVVALTAAQHGKMALIGMASLSHYWQRTSFASEKGTIDWDGAADHLMRSCRDVGIYDPDRLRGRGAWVDDGRSVLHTGGNLIVDGKESGLLLTGSRHVYEAAKSLSSVIAEPLSNADANKLVEICKMIRFERGLDGLLLAGFIAVGPICGGLAWRPSLWLTGPKGSGKTYVQENIITPALGGMALQVQSKTSEAGIRQALGSDARPVIFDEAEAEDQAAAYRMQSVLDLVRQSASEGGAEIIKGSQDQKAARRYRVRSCFLFSSINVFLNHGADESRVTVLSMLPARTETEEDRKQTAAHFEQMKRKVATTITADFAAGLLARSSKHLVTIRANAEVFAQAVSIKLGSRRLGDQIGTLLAGAWSLFNTRPIAMHEAIDWINKQDWESSAPEQIEDTDELKLLSHLTQFRVRISAGNGSNFELTVGRMIQAACRGDHQVMRETAEIELMQMGIKPRVDGVHFSTNHPAIRKLLAGTPWSAKWSRSLLRLPGAISSQANIRFGLGHQGKAVFVPIQTLDPSDAGLNPKWDEKFYRENTNSPGLTR